MFIDTHCHIDQYKNPIQLVRDCEKNRILTIGVTNLPSHYLVGKKNVINSRFFKLAIGFHPLAVEHKCYKKELEIFRQHVLHCDYIGEIGLDFTNNVRYGRETQIDVFCQVLHLIGEKKKFISVHSRYAEKEVLKYLIEMPCPVVMHWYTGSLTLIDHFISEGHFFSVNPSMVQTEKGKLLIEKVPRNRILSETDGPYVKIAGRQALPPDVRIVIKGLSSLWNTTEGEVQQQIQDNFETLTDIQRSW